MTFEELENNLLGMTKWVDAESFQPCLTAVTKDFRFFSYSMADAMDVKKKNGVPIADEFEVESYGFDYSVCMDIPTENEFIAKNVMATREFIKTLEDNNIPWFQEKDTIKVKSRMFYKSTDVERFLMDFLVDYPDKKFGLYEVTIVRSVTDSFSLVQEQLKVRYSIE